MLGLNTQKFQLIEKGIDAATLRHQILANNIANVNTPNFKRSDVRFSDLLKRYLDDEDNFEIEGKVTDPRHIKIGEKPDLSQMRPQVFQEDTTEVRNDGNNVNIEFETAQIIKNSLYLQTLYTMFTQDMQKIRIAMAKGV